MQKSNKVELKKCAIYIKSDDNKTLKQVLMPLYGEGKVKFSCYVFFFTDEKTPLIKSTALQMTFGTKDELTKDFRREIYESIYEKANLHDITIESISIDYNIGTDSEQRYKDN